MPVYDVLISLMHILCSQNKQVILFYLLLLLDVVAIYLPIFFGSASPPLDQSHNWSSASELTLTNMGNIAYNLSKTKNKASNARMISEMYRTFS